MYLLIINIYNQFYVYVNNIRYKFEYIYKVMEELYTEIFDPNNIIRYKFPQSLPNHIKPIRDSFNLLLKSLSFKILGGGYDKVNKCFKYFYIKINNTSFFFFFFFFLKFFIFFFFFFFFFSNNYHLTFLILIFYIKHNNIDIFNSKITCVK